MSSDSTLFSVQAGLSVESIDLRYSRPIQRAVMLLSVPPEVQKFPVMSFRHIDSEPRLWFPFPIGVNSPGEGSAMILSQ